MDYISFFLSVTVSHLSMYFYHIDSKKNRFWLKPNNTISDDAPKFLETTINDKNDVVSTDLDKRFSDNKLMLNRNLKHLELINYLESQLDNESTEKMSIDFLNEFKSIKETVQLKTIEVSQKLS